MLHALPFSPICQPVRSGVHLVRWAWERMGSPVIMCHPRFFQPGLKPGEKLQDMSSVLKRWFDEIVHRQPNLQYLTSCFWCNNLISHQKRQIWAALWLNFFFFFRRHRSSTKSHHNQKLSLPPSNLCHYWAHHFLSYHVHWQHRHLSVFSCFILVTTFRITVGFFSSATTITLLLPSLFTLS